MSGQRCNAEIDWRGAADAAKNAVLVPEVLRAFGARRRGKNRFDCRFCTGRGHQRGTLSVVKDRGWRCHRCGEHGDVITLVMKLRRCDFVTALKYLAELGRVSLPTPITPAERRYMQEQELLFKRVHTAADRLEAEQNALRLQYRAAIHISERLMSRIGARLDALRNGDGDEVAISSYWAWLALLWETFQESLAAYSILSFGNARTRARFTMQPVERHQMTAELRFVGHLFDDDDRWLEVLT